MRKLVSAVLGLGLVYAAGLSAQAEILKNLKTSGQIDVQAFSVNNEQDLTGTLSDKENQVQSRVTAGLSFDLLDDVHAKVYLRKNNRLYGNAGERVLDGAANTGALNNLWVDQASLKIDELIGSYDVTLGRQFYGDPGDLTIYFGPAGISAAGLRVTSVDIGRVDATHWDDKLAVTAIGGKITETGTPTTRVGDLDDDVYGVNLGLRDVVPNNTVGLYAYERNVNADGGAPPSNQDNSLYVYGVRTKGSASVVDATLNYAGEFAFNAGRNKVPAADPAYTGYAFWGQVGGALRGFDLSGQFSWGSGNDGTTAKNEAFTAVRSDLRFGQIFGGHFQALGDLGVANGLTYPAASGLGNLVTWNLGASHECPWLGEKARLGVRYYDFRAQDTGTAGYAATGNDHIGSELDFSYDIAHSDNVGLGLGIAWFWPGGGEAAGANTSPVFRYGSTLQVRF
ncbi:MAG: hypothetical protein HY402_01230 [Elusimicrobia bacterium]|nr:hypothetical protein [Elusimicrobiota bacterium]